MKPDLEHGAKVAATFPNRLVETSAGWILLGPQLAPGLRREDVNISIPLDEAERIADAVLEEWRSRGHPRRGRRERRSFLGFMIVAGVVVLFALLGVVLAVWAVVS